MYRLITVDGNSIRLDEAAVSEMLNVACRRNDCRLAIQGVIADGERIAFLCTDALPEQRELVYRLAPVPGNGNQAEIEAELRSRYDNGFQVPGGFRLADGYWMLTAKEAEQKD